MECGDVLIASRLSINKGISQSFYRVTKMFESAIVLNDIMNSKYGNIRRSPKVRQNFTPNQSGSNWVVFGIVLKLNLTLQPKMSENFNLETSNVHSLTNLKRMKNCENFSKQSVFAEKMLETRSRNIFWASQEEACLSNTSEMNQHRIISIRNDSF